MFLGGDRPGISTAIVYDDRVYVVDLGVGSLQRLRHSGVAGAGGVARGIDYLVHEVIDPDFVDREVATRPPEATGPTREHLLAAHTTIEQVGRDVAEPAGAQNLVLSHRVPKTNPMSRWKQAQRGCSGRLIVGEDLMGLSLG